MINSIAAHGSFHESNFDPKDRVVELEKLLREVSNYWFPEHGMIDYEQDMWKRVQEALK